MPQNAIDVKQENIRSVLWSLYPDKCASGKAVTQMTGLSFATVNPSPNALVRSGKVLPGDTLPSSGGRPSQTYRFNRNFAHVLALSVGVRAGHNCLHACVCDLCGETVWETDWTFEDITLDSLECVVDACLSEDPIIHVLAVSLPGTALNGTVLTSDYPALAGLPLTQHLEQKYHLLTLLENDVNAAVFGFSQNIGQASATAGIYFPKHFNPGAGFVIDGKILTGAGGYAGEIGLIPLGFEWTALDYENTLEISAAITQLIGIISCVINPHQIILYGDFFSEPVRAAIQTALRAQEQHGLFPPLTFKQDLKSDILSGLFAQSLAAYRNEPARGLS